MPRRIPWPAPDKTPAAGVAEHIIVYRPEKWLPPGLDPALAGDQELRESYQRHVAARVEWYATHDLRPVSELLADVKTLEDTPFDPYSDPP